MSINLISSKFRKDIAAVLRAALAAHVAIIEGTKVIGEKATAFPNKKVEVEEHPTNTAYLTIHMGITNRDLHDYLTQNPYQVIGIFHADLLQHWYDFLGEIYFTMVMDVLKGKRQWPLPKAQVFIDLSEREPKLSEHYLANELHNSFAFLSPKQKREIIFKAVSTSKSLDNRLKKIKSEISTIEQNVTIRNVLQHHHGKIIKADLDRHGASHFEIVVSDKKKIKVKALEKIYRTYKDLEVLSSAMSKAAEELRKTYIVASHIDLG